MPVDVTGTDRDGLPMLIYPNNTNQNRKLSMAKPKVTYNVDFFATARQNPKCFDIFLE